MAVWKYACKTVQGMNLDLKIVERVGLPLRLTRAVSGAGSINPTQLMKLMNVLEPVQELQLLDVVEHIAENTVMIPIILRNSDVMESYDMCQLGIYADDPDLGEILYIVLQSEGMEEIPSAAEMKDFKLEWYLNISVSNAENIEVVIDENGVLTVEQGDARYVFWTDYERTVEEIRAAAEADKETLKDIIGEVERQAEEALDGKVDKVPGKGLSTNDYTTEEKEKLGGIAEGAEVNVQADWAAGDTDSDAYIKNKPSSLPASDVYDWAKQPIKPAYTKGEVGLGNLDNTSDLDKPVSTAQQAALDELYQQMAAYTRQKIADLVGGADTSMDTLKEVEAAIKAHKSVMDALDAAIGKKANAAEFDSHVKDSTAHVTESERTKWNGKADNTNMTAATASAAGKAGLVPAPAKGAANRYLRSDGTWQVPPDTDTVYSHPTTSGNRHIPAGGSAGQILRWSADGTATWGADNNTTYSSMTGATASAAGNAGLVPAPAKGAQNSYLTGAGTWQSADDHTAAFTSADVADGSATAWTSVAKLASGETLKSIFNKVSTMFKNVRYLYKLLGATSISDIGDGTVTGALASLNSGMDGMVKIVSGTMSGNFTAGQSGWAQVQVSIPDGYTMIGIRTYASMPRLVATTGSWLSDSGIVNVGYMCTTSGKSDISATVTFIKNEFF